MNEAVCKGGLISFLPKIAYGASPCRHRYPRIAMLPHNHEQSNHFNEKNVKTHDAAAISFWNRIPKPSIPLQQWGKCGIVPSFGFTIKIHDHDRRHNQFSNQCDEKGQADQQTDVEGAQKVGENQHQKSTGKNQ